MNNRLSLILETVQIIVEQERKLVTGAEARKRVSREDPSVVALPPAELKRLEQARVAAAILRAEQKAAKRAPISADNPPTEGPQPGVGSLFGTRFSKRGERLPVAVGQVNDEGINAARLSGKTVVAMLGPAGGVRHKSQEEIAAGNLKPNTKKTGKEAEEAIKRARISPTAQPSPSIPLERAIPGGKGIPQINLGSLISGKFDDPRTRSREGGPKRKKRKPR